MNEQQEREAFDAWFYSGAAKDSPSAIEAWPAWQARSKLAVNVPAGFVLVNAGALQMVRNALKRDADDGRTARGEMLAELDAVTKPAPAPEADALEKAREARRQAQTETAAIKGDILKVASAVTKAGLTLVKTADGFEVRKFGPAQAQHYSTTDGTRCDNCGDALSKHTGGGRYCAEPVKPAPAQAQQPRLLPCPFCGSHVIAREGFHMTCFACGAEGTEADEANDEAAAAAWNRRAKAKPEAQQPKGLTTERLRQMHHEDEFGLFCDFDEFEQIARAVEQEHSIGASGEASND